MSEKIYTIPINEAFDRFSGCPMCYLKDKLEENTLSHCLGAAMMEPDVRIEMNSKGFCHTHISKLSTMKNKLGLALILESHLDELKKSFSITPAGGKKTFFSAKPQESDGTETLNDFIKTCYACEKIRSTEGRYFSNTIYLWDTDNKFKEKLLSQPYFCVTHTAALLKAAKNELKSIDYALFYTDIMDIEDKYFTKIKEDVSKFCVSFDHRNADKPLGDEKYCIDKSISLLK